MIRHPSYLDASSPQRVADEASAAAFAFASDVNAVVDAASAYAPTLAMLAEFATVTQGVALREAAGSPVDERWRIAYDALAEFLTYSLRHSSGDCASRAFVRLSSFLVENADLARTAVGRSSEDSK